ncbi:DUF952 domain-containing protein [Pacificispira sp.]|uniref:DUF952 domain-containing protein n=1 Tax=Pacificispira sp. TaxID=2888761 RepID=UPI003B51AF9C
MIYHLAKQQAWQAAQQSGRYTGLEADRADGFLHFSTAEQIAESARKHRAGEADLVLLGVEEAPLGETLVWEKSRGGALFPHVYGDVPLDAIRLAAPLPLGADGAHVFPELPGDHEPS